MAARLFYNLSKFEHVYWASRRLLIIIDDDLFVINDYENSLVDVKGNKLTLPFRYANGNAFDDFWEGYRRWYFRNENIKVNLAILSGTTKDHILARKNHAHETTL